MGTHIFSRHTIWTVFVSLLVALGMGACSDVSNAPAPAAGPTVLTITSPATLPAGSIGIPYSTTLTAAGGTQPFGWSIPSGQTPAPGLTMDSNGVISGIPTNTGSTTRTYRVVDSAQPTQSFETQLTIAINSVPQPQISLPASLPSGVVGTTYPVTLTASGGTPPYTTWTVTPTLPAGLTFTPTGDTATITGIPQAPSSNNYTFRVTDSFSPTPQTGARAYTLNISAAPAKLTISSPATLPPGTVNQGYSEQLTSTGGTGTVSWSLSSSTPNPILPGLSLSSGGLLSGSSLSSPAVTNYAMRFRVQDSAFPADTDEKTLTITTSLPTALNITTPSLPNGVLNQPYDQPLAASGGSGTRTWSFQGGTIPNLSINSSTGRITGNPTPTGPSFTFTVQVTDALFTATKQFTIAITAPPAPTINSPASLPTGTVNVDYPATTLSASGGAPPLAFQPVGLPFGLSFNAATATISGMPTSSGSQPVTFTVNDSTVPFNQTGTRQYTLTVNAALTIGTSSLDSGTVGTSYSTSPLTASGGTPPYTWSITGTGAPNIAAPGLTLSSGGVISGIPTTDVGSPFTRTYRVQDNNGVAATKQLSITINAAPIPPNITTTNADLPNGLVNGIVPYSRTLTATGGTGALTWSVLSGALPTGLTLSTAGEISGTPSVAGTFDFTPQATDTLLQTDSTPPLLSITIDP